MSGANRRLMRGIVAKRTVPKCPAEALACLLGQEVFDIDLATPLSRRPLPDEQSSYEIAKDLALNCRDLLPKQFDIWPYDDGFERVEERKLQSWVANLREYFEPLLLTLLYDGLGKKIPADQHKQKQIKEAAIFEAFQEMDEEDLQVIGEACCELHSMRNEQVHRYEVIRRTGKRHIKRPYKPGRAFDRSLQCAKRVIGPLVARYRRHFGG